MIENPSKIDILIPDPSLDEKHAHIFCRREDEFGSQFIIKDISEHDQDKSDSFGVWAQLPGHEIDLLTFDYMDRDFSVLNGRYLFKFT